MQHIHTTLRHNLDSWSASIAEMKTMKVSGADTVFFERNPDSLDYTLVAKARGELFREKTGDDPLAAASRLAMQIRMRFDIGKRYRAFRTKLRSIRSRH